MLTCSSCKTQFPAVKDILTHIRKHCTHYWENSLCYKCGERECFKQFTSVDAFRHHLKSKHILNSNFSFVPPYSGEATSNNSRHTVDAPSNLEEREIPCNAAAEATLNNSQHNVNVDAPSVLEEGEMTDTANNLVKHTSQFIASLYSNPSIPRSTVQTVVDGLKLFHVNFSDTLRQQFQTHETTENNANAYSSLDGALTMLKDCMLPFTSEFKRFKMFSLIGTYIPPFEVVVGYRKDTEIRRGQQLLKSKQCTVEVIPLRDVFKQFFAIETVWRETMDYLNHLEGSWKEGSKSLGLHNCVENVVQGSVWQKAVGASLMNVDSSTLTLPLVVYYDDFEIGNPLGSHAGIHKLGGLYVSVATLPPHFVSQLNNIFMLALCHSSDKNRFGNVNIFQAAISELNYLQTSGVVIDTPFFKGILKFRIICLTGDNLGLNSILGFTECFVANYYCRVCNAHKNTMQSMTLEDTTLLRNKISYDEQLKLNDVSKTGIIEPCCWMELRGFDLFDNVAMDIMHDLLEGVARYVMTFVINYYTSRSLPPMNTLKQSLSYFNYGPDSGSKPSSCLLSDSKPGTIKLKTSAIEMQTLIRYFGLIAGYYVPADDEVWELYLSMRQIFERLMSHRVYIDTIEQLKYMISDFNSLYCKVTGEKLKPKFHFLTHYPEMLKKFGPLRHVWSMRFESKHKLSKMAAVASCNRQNVCKTLAIKNQLILNDLFVKKKLTLSFSCGKKKVLSDNHCLGAVPNVSISFSIPWVKQKGVLWKKSDVATLDICDDTCLPVFALIESILVTENNEVYFSCLLFDTILFDDHCFAYEVTRTSETCCCSLESLLAPYPNTLTVAMDSSMFVTQRWPLD